MQSELPDARRREPRRRAFDLSPGRAARKRRMALGAAHAGPTLESIRAAQPCQPCGRVEPCQNRASQPCQIDPPTLPYAGRQKAEKKDSFRGVLRTPPEGWRERSRFAR